MSTLYYSKFNGGKFGTGSLPTFPNTGRIANGTGDAYLGRKDGTGPKDEGSGKSDRVASKAKSKTKVKKRRRRRVNIKKIKGL